MAPPKPTSFPDAQKKEVNDEWRVRPGETFREFNARVKMAGLTVPPGVSSSFRAGDSVSSSAPVVTAEKRHTDDPAAQALSPEVAGANKKKRRKEKLKERKIKKMQKLEEERSEKVIYQEVGLKKTVNALPSINVKPKAILKTKNVSKNANNKK